MVAGPEPVLLTTPEKAGSSTVNQTLSVGHTESRLVRALHLFEMSICRAHMTNSQVPMQIAVKLNKEI